MNDIGNLLQMIYDLLSGWFNSFTSHALAVMEKLNLIETDTASIKNSASGIKSNTDDIKDNTGAIVTPVLSIKTNTDSIKTDTTTIKNNVSTMSNQLGTISTNVGTASAFTEDVANNTLDIKDRIVTIGSDTTQLRSNSNTITSDVSDIKTALNYYLANTPVTEDIEGSICNFDTDLEDYLQKAVVTIPTDLTGFSGITLTKCGKNIFNIAVCSYIQSNILFGGTWSGSNPLINNSLYLEAGTYTISANEAFTGWYLFDSNGLIATKYNSNFFSFTLTESKYVMIRCYKSGTSSISDFTQYNIQLESGIVSEFEPYKAMTYPITFGSTITDGAEINLLDGIVKVNSTPVSYLSISPIAVRTYKGINNIYSDIGTTALTYRETLKHYLDKQEA